LVTPLVFENGKAVLVARGWVPQELAAPEHWTSLQEPEGSSVIGLIQQSQTIEGAPSTGPQQEWYRIDVPLIQEQLPYELLPAFVLQLPEEGRSYDQLPYRTEPIQLDEGSHLSYSIQWFSFALILAFGYIQFVRLQDARAIRVAQQRADEAINSAACPDSDSSTNS
jgi:surfeit locus 1 family protein